MKPLKLLTVVLLGAGTFASAASVTSAVKTEINQLARQYTGRPCLSNGEYGLDTEPFGRKVSPSELKTARDSLYRQLLEGFDQSARKNHFTYEVRYNQNRVWVWAKAPDSSRQYFTFATLSPTGIRMVSCLQ